MIEPIKPRALFQHTHHRNRFGEEVGLVVTIENQSQWPMTAYPLPPAREVREEVGPGPLLWWQQTPGQYRVSVRYVMARRTEAG